jgi:RNA polymerase III RPC4
MAPPPSQQGKFKPRKPAKKIRPGVTADGTGGESTGATDSATTQTVAFASATGDAADRAEQSRSNTGRGGRGGRDGRGRGRGRTPIPSGRVFFSGSTEAASSASKRRPGGGSSLASSSQKTAQARTAADKAKAKEMDTTEEVVGLLETAIGTTTDGKGSTTDRMERSGATALDYDDQGDGGGAGAKASFTLDAFMYDSDSSREEYLEKRETKRPLNLPPLELPFPDLPLPLGIGCPSRPVAYERVMSSSDADARGAVGTIHQELLEPAMSPFVDTRESDKMALEQDSWFLVQLPTRLPPLQTTTSFIPSNILSSDNALDDANPNQNAQQSSPFADVVTPPVTSNTHDNVLTGTAPGRIGKLIVYKSGKTVLKMEGPAGTKPIFMQVSEGLSCGFRQEAVVIDQEMAKFVALGNVNKSMVVTPDLG